MIVQALRQIQKKYGFLRAAELRALSQETSTPLYRLQEVASFFPYFRLERDGPPPAVQVKVCRDMTCHLRGAADLTRELCALCKEFGPERLSVAGCSCLGRCDRAPVISLAEHHGQGEARHLIYAGRSSSEFVEIVRHCVAGCA